MPEEVSTTHSLNGDFEFECEDGTDAAISGCRKPRCRASSRLSRQALIKQTCAPQRFDLGMT